MMRDAQRCIAIIPARAGSKRLPNKNSLLLDDHPLISWTIRAALDSGAFERVLVSTDSPFIADISRSYGAEVPFLRPAPLASDEASSADVVLHALTAADATDMDAFCLLQPTSPMRRARHIQESRRLMQERQADNVVSVCECEHSPLWSNTLPESGSLAGFIRQEYRGLRSQDLPAYYRVNGAIYWVGIARFLQERRFLLDDSSYAYKMHPEDSVDIDHELDLELCRLLATRPRFREG